METIASIATAPGEAGIAIVRVSGPEALPILSKLFRKRAKGSWQSHRLAYGAFLADGEEEEGMAVFMRAPNSYTREDVAEIHCHGGGIPARRVLAAACAAGARLAEPGEFTKRAFLNGRVSLDQAEAVMELISARSERAARNALRHMGGALARRVAAAQERLLDIAAALEAFIDYPGEDEEIERSALGQAMAGIGPMQEELEAALRSSRNAELLSEGLSIVLFGSPNAGKSSLLNRLLDEERAIVSASPGTTRDVLRETVSLDGLPVRLIDTAGLREGAEEAERIGIERAGRELERADIRLLVLDGTRQLWEQAHLVKREEGGAPLVIALNKSDLPALFGQEELLALCPGAFVAKTCAKSGEGVPALREALRGIALREGSPEGAVLHSARQRTAAEEAVRALARARAALREGLMDCAALDVREAWRALGLITGSSAEEKLIDRIFERFCLGK
ncbi:MAG: tRNA uridine-5-carboxymethylaminomethyl(34) synthesis GTPase MnmE [Christensenellaceae bacterium]|jgi:tRNA modification GTPase|nr:tRNA uridine-5-carboxymethylaminomethyl(34) synthesis GTPase MnmE [Christensenellaceae bacterium]